jgi:hypothetical protein
MSWWDHGSLSRRDLLQRLLGTAATPLALSACGESDAPQSPPTPPDINRLITVVRLKAALNGAVSPTVTSEPLTVTQGPAYSADPGAGAGAKIYPVPRGAENPNRASLATLPEVWGYHRETWGSGVTTYIGSAVGNDSWYVPLAWWHRAETQSAFSTCGLHFILEGRAFEVLFAGDHVQSTVIADGKFMSSRYITTAMDAGVPGAPLASPNAYVRFDFGYAARRRISLYAASSQGPCALAIDGSASITPWDRSTEASFCAMADSYGQSPGVNWPLGGPFWEAASLLGLTHLDLNAIGGTGFSTNPSTADTMNAGNAFGARVASVAATRPDLLLTAGSINDNIVFPEPPLVETAESARARFQMAVNAYFRDLRMALPESVLVAMGPWSPVESVPVSPIAQSKAQVIMAGLRAAGEPWVFVDNLNGGWVNSSGVQAPPVGRGWQTGTGNTARPTGDGNGDLYVAGDGVHPTPSGCVYLAHQLATNLRAAILAL